MVDFVVLIISVCSILENTCKDERIPLREDVNIVQCTIHGQFEVVEWAARHPNWSIRRWKCDANHKKEADI